MSVGHVPSNAGPSQGQHRAPLGTGMLSTPPAVSPGGITADESALRRLSWVALGAVTALYAVAIVPPWTSEASSSFLLDTSWVLALHHAFASSLAFGRDVVFTFGPWGFLFGSMYHPATHGVAV